MQPFLFDMGTQDYSSVIFLLIDLSIFLDLQVCVGHAFMHLCSKEPSPNTGLKCLSKKIMGPKKTFVSLKYIDQEKCLVQNNIQSKIWLQKVFVQKNTLVLKNIFPTYFGLQNIKSKKLRVQKSFRLIFFVYISHLKSDIDKVGIKVDLLFTQLSKFNGILRQPLSSWPELP